MDASRRPNQYKFCHTGRGEGDFRANHAKIRGVGKSTAAKSLILSEFMSGTTIICIDPEREVRDMCRKLGGDWINCGGGSGGLINPLQIRPAPVDEDDENDKLYGDDSSGMGAQRFSLTRKRRRNPR
jgi:hypothetical protein